MDIQQVKDDFDRGVIVSHDTMVKVVEEALRLQETVELLASQLVSAELEVHRHWSVNEAKKLSDKT